VRLYFHVGTYFVYGQFPPGRGLDTFYGRFGFDILDHADGVSVEAVFGIPLVFGADPGSGEQLFVRWRGAMPRSVWHRRR